MNDNQVLRPQNCPAVPLAKLVQGHDIELLGRDGQLVPASTANIALAAGGQVLITGVSHDSRQVQPGDLYFALPGANAHGGQFAKKAAEVGAKAVLTDATGAELAAGAGLVCLVADNPRELMGPLSASCYQNPADKLLSFALTGTNGKTTTAVMLAGALGAAGLAPGLIGTLGFSVDGRTLATKRSTVTTPEATELQALLAVMVEQGAKSMAMEVSSHALALARTKGIVFDVVGFTNLGRDHLDFHHTMAEYKKAKAQLFTPSHAKAAVINIDDAAGVEFLAQAKQLGLPAYGISASQPTDFRIISWVSQGSGSKFTLVGLDQEINAYTALPGEYNVRNAATALAMLLVAGVPTEKVLAGLAEAKVPGRMEPVELGENAPRVYVDFAHTPQAIESALTALQETKQAGQKIIAVFGAGGDRDPDKRPLMGRAGAALADIVIVTDDNPRSEEPAEIRAQVLAGAQEYLAQNTGASQVLDGGDRTAAIGLSLAKATSQDAIAVLGKGHERTQIVKDQVLEFDDVAVIKQLWQAGEETDSDATN